MKEQKQTNGFKQLGKRLKHSDSLEGNVKRVLDEKFDGNKNNFMRAFVAQINQ